MGAFNNSSVVATELEKVTTKLPEAFESDDKFFANIKKADVEKISYRQMRAPIAIRPGGAFQYFQPNGNDLGRGGGPSYEKAVLQPVFMSENIEYTKLAQWGTDDDRKAIINAVRKLTAGAMVELRRQLDAQMMQTGTGVIGTITTPTTTAGVEQLICTTDGFGVRLMRYGQTIQVFDSTLATLKGSAEITFWDPANSIVKITPAIGTTGGDLIVTNGISSPSSLPGLYGVPYHHSNASTGTWLGFNRATTPEIRSNGINANSATLSWPLPRRAINAIGNRVGIDKNFKCNAWMHPAQQQQYEQMGQLVSIIQKQPKAEGLNLYFGDDMQMAGAPVKPHFNWDKTRIDFVVDETWNRGEILPIGFYTTDGRNIFELRGPSGGVATADIFYMVVGMQTFVDNPANTAYIYSLAVPSGY
jgi:hypothetical protein